MFHRAEDRIFTDCNQQRFDLLNVFPRQRYERAIPALRTSVRYYSHAHARRCYSALRVLCRREESDAAVSCRGGSQTGGYLPMMAKRFPITACSTNSARAAWVLSTGRKTRT